MAADLTGKGKPDIVLDDYQAIGSQELYVLYNEGTAGWNEVFPSFSCGPIANLSVNYIHGGLEPDIAGSFSTGVSVFVTSASGVVTSSACLGSYRLDGSGFPIITDVNGDGVADVVWFEVGDVGIFLGEGKNTFVSTPVFFGTESSPVAAFALNLHHQSAGSGTPDLVEVDSSGVIVTLINETQ